MNKLNVTQCKGEGQGSCKRCIDNGKWNQNWMRFIISKDMKDVIA